MTIELDGRVVDFKTEDDGTPCAALMAGVPLGSRIVAVDDVPCDSRSVIVAILSSPVYGEDGSTERARYTRIPAVNT